MICSHNVWIKTEIKPFECTVMTVITAMAFSRLEYTSTIRSAVFGYTSRRLFIGKKTNPRLRSHVSYGTHTAAACDTGSRVEFGNRKLPTRPAYFSLVFFCSTPDRVFDRPSGFACPAARALSPRRGGRARYHRGRARYHRDRGARALSYPEVAVWSISGHEDRRRQNAVGLRGCDICRNDPVRLGPEHLGPPPPPPL